MERFWKSDNSEKKWNNDLWNTILHTKIKTKTDVEKLSTLAAPLICASTIFAAISLHTTVYT